MEDSQLTRINLHKLKMFCILNTIKLLFITFMMTPIESSIHFLEKFNQLPMFIKKTIQVIMILSLPLSPIFPQIARAVIPASPNTTGDISVTPAGQTVDGTVTISKFNIEITGVNPSGTPVYYKVDASLEGGGTAAILSDGTWNCDIPEEGGYQETCQTRVRYTGGIVSFFVRTATSRANDGVVKTYGLAQVTQDGEVVFDQNRSNNYAEQTVKKASILLLPLITN